MKNLFLLAALLFCSTLTAQIYTLKESTEKVIIDNDKMKVIEFNGLPNQHVCGAGMHHHAPHLTVLLTDAKVEITPENGESQLVEVPSGTSFWSETETHAAINKGSKPTKLLLVFLKD